MCDTSFLHKAPGEQRASGVFYRAAAEQSHRAQKYVPTALGGEVHRIFPGVQHFPTPAGLPWFTGTASTPWYSSKPILAPEKHY